MEERELPVGWEIITLSEAATWGSGGTPSRKNPEYYGGTIPWVKTGELGPRILSKTEETISELGLVHSSAKIFPAGCIAVAMYGATIGKASILGIAAATNQACAVAVADPLALRTGFLFHYLCSQRDEFANAGKGGAQPNISQSLIKDWPFPLAPLNEQRRIAAKLDTTLAAVDACRQRLDGVAVILKRFRQAVLAAATSGELTREWREEQGAPEWELLLASEVCNKVQSGGTPKAGFINEPGVPFLKVYNLVDQSVDFDYRPQYVDPEVHLGPLAKSRAMPGDVLMNIVGPPLGKVAILPDAHDEWNINQAICLFRPSSRITTEWLYHLLCEGANIRQIQLETKGSAGQINISLTQCRQFEFSVPSIEEQHEISRRVESLFTLANQLETRLTAARKIVDRLTPALLAKAFRGELVPQDPNDEPASVLLERIRAARQAEATAAKPSRRRRPKAAATPEPIALEAAPAPADFLTALLRECGALTERALLAASELELQRFQRQLQMELESGSAREVQCDGQVMLDAVG